MKILKNIQLKENKRKIFPIMAFSVLLLGFSYLYFLHNMVFYTAEFERLEKEIPVLNANLNSNFFEYISMKNDLDKEFALQNGFMAMNDIEYVSPQAHALSSGMGF